MTGMGRNRLCCIFVAALLLLLFATGCASRQLSMITVTLEHTDDAAAVVTADNDRVFIDVTDGRGINGLTAEIDDGRWPDEITVLLRLRGLEQLEISYDNVVLATGLSSNDSPDPPLMLTVRDDQGNSQSASPSADIYYPDIERTTEGFEITLPSHFFLEERPMFSLRWIDFYR